MSFRDLMARWPLLTAVCFQALLIPLALLLGLLAGVAPWTDLAPEPWAVIVALAATVPLVLTLHLLSLYGGAAFGALEELVRDALARLFANASPGAVPIVALLAGLGEELLFRGVLQSWLATHLAVEWAIVLSAGVFGLAHYVNRLYFVIATAMGVYLGVLYHWTGNLLTVCLVHAFYDWIAIRIYLGRGR